MDLSQFYSEGDARRVEKLSEIASKYHEIVYRYSPRMGESIYMIDKSGADPTVATSSAFTRLTILAFEIGFVKGQRAAAINGVNVYDKEKAGRARPRRKQANK